MFTELVNIESIQKLLESNYKVTGSLSAILDTEENILAAAGWQKICTRFHRAYQASSALCRESDAYIKQHLHDQNRGFLEYKCKNGLQEAALPIMVNGEHLATFFMGQFFYDDDKPDEEFFRRRGRLYGYEENAYLDALRQVPVLTRQRLQNIMEYNRNLVEILAEMGMKNLLLAREVTDRKRAEQEVQESKDFLSKIINTIADPIFAKDRNHRIILANDAECDLAGFRREEIIGRTDYDFFPREQVDVFWEKDELVFETGRENINEEEITDAQGKKRTIVTKKTLLNDSSGQSYLVGIIRDITGIKQTERALRALNEDLEKRVAMRTADLVASNASLCREIDERCRAEKDLLESKEKYKAILEAIDGYVYICSPDFRIEFMNGKFIERTGYDATGELCYKVLHERDSVCPWCVNEQVFQGRTVRWEIQSPKDRRWYYVVNTPIYHTDGSISKQAMILDITDRKSAEEQLKKKKEMLEALNCTLEKRIREEVAKNREKDSLLIQQNRQAALGETLEHIAHQWKQPINTVSLLIQDLEESYSSGELTDTYFQETVNKIMSVTGHMADTINVIRDFYKPDREMRVFRIGDSIHRVLSFIEPAFRYLGVFVRLDVAEELFAAGYPKAYAQVILNILTNSLDAFRENKVSDPAITIRAFGEAGKSVVTITDNAGGIPESFIDKIFDLYFTTRESKGGSGIGLYLSKNIIEKKMGGTMTATNVDHGAQFRIELATPRS